MQRAVEEYVSSEPIGDGLDARFQRWGRARGNRFRSAVLVGGFAVPIVLAAALNRVLPPWALGAMVALAVGSFGVAMSGIDGKSQWFRMTDRLVSTVPRVFITLALTVTVLVWLSGVLLVWVQPSDDATVALIMSLVMLCIAFGFKASVFTVNRVRPHLGFAATPDTVARLITLASALLVPVWIWNQGDEQETTSGLIAAVLAVLGVLGVAFIRALSRRRAVTTHALVAADELRAALCAYPLDPATVLSTATRLDRALSTRLTSGFRPLGVPLADSRSRAALLSTVHALLGLAHPHSKDEAVAILRKSLASEDHTTLRQELSDYCLHIRVILHTHADVAALA